MPTAMQAPGPLPHGPPPPGGEAAAPTHTLPTHTTHPHSHTKTPQPHAPATRDKPTGILVTAILFWIMTPVAILGAVFAGFAFIALEVSNLIRFNDPATATLAYLPFILTAQAALNVAGGVGLWRLRAWGRWIALASCAFWLSWGLLWTTVAPLEFSLLVILPNAAGLLYLLLPATAAAFRPNPSAG